MRKLNEIIIHCTATDAKQKISVSDVRQWHIKRGFKDIGYHFLILQSGEIQIGRPLEVIGAHVKNHNTGTIGICYVGGLDHQKPKDTRTPEQKQALIKLVKELRARFKSITTVSGHNKYANKACPCFDVSKESPTFEV